MLEEIKQTMMMMTYSCPMKSIVKKILFTRKYHIKEQNRHPHNALLINLLDKSLMHVKGIQLMVE
ncbi:hypothetical protein PVAP13_8KG170701 [Panicum virgatum]|uniref:Uncharacterized protein n=1 Tax=Panicum virgatum TaxID=38727 RepID=A0A8T0PRR4_PANVG|nr:hypothetical protein PVAP13_8KG170701 [Panicum virgatum]